MAMSWSQWLVMPWFQLLCHRFNRYSMFSVVMSCFQ